MDDANAKRKPPNLPLLNACGKKQETDTGSCEPRELFSLLIHFAAGSAAAIENGYLEPIGIRA